MAPTRRRRDEPPPRRDPPVANSTFVPAAAFPSPLALTWATTQGADVSWVPMAFTRSLPWRTGARTTARATSSTELVPGGAPTLAAHRCVGATTPPAPTCSASSRSRRHRTSRRAGRRGDRLRGTVTLPRGGQATAWPTSPARPCPRGAAALPCPLGEARAGARRARTCGSPGTAAPAVHRRARLPLLRHRLALQPRAAAVPGARRFPVSDPLRRAGAWTFAVYFPMPFSAARTSSSSEAAGRGAGRRLAVADGAARGAAPAPGYFHATYVDQRHARRPGRTWSCSTRRGSRAAATGAAASSARRSSSRTRRTCRRSRAIRASSSTTARPRRRRAPAPRSGGRRRLLGRARPRRCPCGHPVGRAEPRRRRAAEDAIESAYRFLLADALPFGKNARIQLEHGGMDDSTEHYGRWPTGTAARARAS